MSSSLTTAPLLLNNETTLQLSENDETEEKNQSMLPTSSTHAEQSSAMTKTIFCNQPNQPRNYKFPRQKFGNFERAFQSKWFDQFKWLHYDQEKDAVFCVTCINAIQKKK